MSSIEAKDLTRKFGQLIAVDHVNFHVESGEVFGLLGPNGAGKTTLIRMLCTLLRPTEGTAQVAGFDIRKQPSQVREHIGLVTEKIILYDRLTAEENLFLFGRLNHLPEQTIKERADRLLRLLKMEEWRKHQGGTFSTGMKQRINIARALITQPSILFLDEPTLGLDPQTTRAIHEFIRELSGQGMTIILTTHIMSEADELSKKIGIIDRGRIVSLDTPAGLKKAGTDNSTTVLNIDIANLTERLITELKNLACVKSLMQEETYRVRLQANGEGAVDRIIDTIRANNGQIRSVSTVEPTLEDVFLNLTGHEIRDEATEKIPSARGHDPHLRQGAKRVR
jgi:ABC-2 type transport system ATP-binding protein